MLNSINRNVSQCHQFTEDELTFFNSLLEFKKVPKKTLLLKEGEICNFEAFIIKGCIRSYYMDENGFEVILNFAIEDWWVSDITSFYEHVPSKMYIETLEDCELLTMTFENKERLLKEVPGFERMFRLMLQRHLKSFQERLMGNISQTAQTRYLAFLQKYPSLPQRIPQHLIAAYLGISPEFLSKIRTKMIKK